MTLEAILVRSSWVALLVNISAPMVFENSSIERLNSFRLLQPGWNGYDADSLDHVVISRAQDLLLEPKILSLTLEIFPTARNSIQFEYRREDGGYLEVEIYDDSFGIYLKAGGEEREEDDLTRDEIVSVIRAFHAK